MRPSARIVAREFLRGESLTMIAYRDWNPSRELFHAAKARVENLLREGLRIRKERSA